MIEYRLSRMPAGLAALLKDAGAFVAEERFSHGVTYLLYSEDDIGDILKDAGAVFSSKNAEETGWRERWKEYIKEGWLAPSLYYVFEPKTFDDGRKTIIINPAMAFGTGAHPTTKIAARLLEKVVGGKTFLDVGAGSGILSIAASVFGAARALALDIDPGALSNCLENIRLNHCSNISARTGEIIHMDDNKKYDVICANIVSGVLKELAPHITRRAGEYIVYSGILESEYAEVLPRLLPEGWIEEERMDMDGWSGARLKKCLP